ncbi:MAG: hypothetical protein KJO98_14295, partial [Rhodothermia bacterium]|nr:hypothetical protein [Rhodothermia bacterium]
MEVTCGSLLVSVDGGLLPGMRSVADARSAVGVATGVAASGARAAVLISGNDLTQVVSELREAASMHLPLLIYHSCDEDHTASRASHDPIATLRDTGCVILHAADAQEVLDLGLVGRRIAEEALVPVVVAQDTFAGPKHVSTIRAPEPELLRSWIGRQGDTISSPTPSQRLLFGESRRRIPRLLNVERPVGLGARLDRESASRALAGQEVFFGEEIPKIADTAFAEFAAATGRNYEPISHYRADDADHIVVAAGRVSRALRDVVDELRTEHRKVGMVEIKMYRPMPEASLASLLSQKKGITVLESVRLGGAQDTPMMVDLRSSLSRSWNTGGSSDSGPNPSGRPRRTARDERQRPALLSAVSQNAAEASHADLRAIFDNMLAEEANVQRYHLGVRFGVPKGSRVPGLERLGQMLENAYDRLNRRGLTGAVSRTASGGEATVIKLVGMADQSVAEAGAALAVGLFRAAGGAVESRPSSTSSTEFEPETCTVCHSPDNSLDSRTTLDADIVAVTRLSMSSDIELVDALRDEGRLVISSDASPQEMWVTVPDRIRKRILDKNLRLSLIPAPSVAERIAGDRWVQNHLEMQCLVGALLQAPELRLEDRKELVDSYRTALSEAWVSGDLLLEQLLQAVDRGAAEVQEVDLRSISTADAKPEKEPPAPWTVRDATEHDDSVYDAGRFWNAVGYLYASGRSEDAMVDPYVASGVLPGKTSAFRTWAPFTSRLPQLLPENCTACGACFVSCPDSALPVT